MGGRSSVLACPCAHAWTFECGRCEKMMLNVMVLFAFISIMKDDKISDSR